MRADHHHLVLEPRVGTGNLSDDVERRRVLRKELVLHVEPDRDRHLLLEDPADPSVRFHRDVHERHLRRPRHARGAIVGADVAAGVPGVGQQHGRDALLLQPAEGGGVGDIEPAAATAPTPARGCRRNRVASQLGLTDRRDFRSGPAATKRAAATAAASPGDCRLRFGHDGQR